MSHAPLFHHSSRFRRWALLVIFVYCAVHLALQVILPTPLPWDDAEQTLWAQEWSWAYGFDQPPMYTWLVHATSAILGPGRLATGLVRYVLLFVMYAGLLLAACALFERRTHVMLALGSYLLFYQYAWYTHKNLTHSTLASAAIAMMLFAFIAAVRTNAWWPYLLLGLAMGCGMMAKYNFAVFAISLFFAAWMIERYRPVFNWRLIPAVVLTVVICAPHYSQLVTSPDRSFAVGSTVSKQAEPESPAQRLLVVPATVAATLALPQPFALVAVLVFPALFGARRFLKPDTDERRLLGLQIIVGIALSTLGGFVIGVAQIKARWLFAALMLAPLYLFSGLREDDGYERRIRGYLGALPFAWLIVIAALIAESPYQTVSGGGMRSHLPVQELSRSIEAMGFSHGPIVGVSNDLAGNLVMISPKADVYSARPDQGPEITPQRFPVLYVWIGPPEPVPDEILSHADALGIAFERPKARMKHLRIAESPDATPHAEFKLWIADRAASNATTQRPSDHEGEADHPAD